LTSETKGVYKVSETVHVNAFLSVPEAEVILRSPDEESWELEKLVQVIARAAAANPGKRCEFWIKLLP
jgi:hypothetical protein